MSPIKTVFDLNFCSFLRFSAIFCCLFLTSCQSDHKKPQRYYYSEEGLEKSIPDSSENVNLDDKKSVVAYIKNKTFVSKIQRLVVDDSLKITHYVNGKKEAVLQCEITEYMVHDNRLLLLTDSATAKQIKYTISSEGVLTDMQTYSLYLLEK